ncbi:hypothetical protein ACIA5D_45760 [Actinoplanes sp. NPDC051513]
MALVDHRRLKAMGRFENETFTLDGRHLFINVQYPGVTCVITGPFSGR